MNTNKAAMHAFPPRPYRGTLLIRNQPRLGLNGRPVPRVLGGSYEGESFPMSKVPLYVTLNCSSPARRERFAREFGNASNPESVFVCIIEECPNLPATPATPSHRSHSHPLFLLGQLGIPGTLLHSGLGGHLTKLGHFGCHGLGEFLLSKLRMENLESQTGITHQLLKFTEVWHWCLVLAQEVEQSVHVPDGLFRPPTCLDKAKGSRIAADLSQIGWIL